MVSIMLLYLIEIPHQTTTVSGGGLYAFELYLIEILHQTTTVKRFAREGKKLYLIEILHQTTTNCRVELGIVRCILLKFYIKPQHRL